MRDSGYRQVIGILARDAVRKESDWHVLNALVVDTASNILSPVERPPLMDFRSATSTQIQAAGLTPAEYR